MIDRHPLLRVEVGSTAHGTGLEGHEDRDEMLIKMETPTAVFGVREIQRATMQRTQPEGVKSGPGDLDLQVYTLRHWLHLASKGNPSIMLALWAPVIDAHPFGLELREHADWFVGRHLIAPYRGYMKAQVDRLLGLRGGRHGKFRDDPAGFDTKYAMHAARLGFQCRELLFTGKLTLPIEGKDGDWLRALRRGEVSKDEWQKVVERLDMQLRDGPLPREIPARPDIEAIEKWSASAHLRYWGYHGG